jgi:GH43 family beta-xylosidase
MPTFTNPIVSSGADPWVVRWEKRYYYCFSRDGRVRVSRADSLIDIGRGKEVAVWTPPAKGPYSKELWAPELHRLGDRFYIYVAADDGDNANHRMYVLEGDTRDPQAAYKFKGKIAPETDRWAIDGTVGTINGHQYFVWSGWEGTENVRQDLFIAAMKDPWTLAGDRACISVPEHPWEKLGPEWDAKGFPGGVNEGPQFLARGKQIHIIYSANGSWTDDYCLGQLTYTGGDPLARKSWRKKEKPVFTRTDKVFGPGHACFVRSADGKEDWIVYHAAKRKGGGWDRDVRAQPFDWDKADSPRFGEPVPPGTPVERPRGG